MTTGTQIWSLALDYFDDGGAIFADATQGLRMVNTALAELHEMLANSKNSDYFRTEQSVTLVAGTESYSLNADFFKAIGIFFVTGSGASERLFPIPRWQPQEVGGFRSSPISSGTVRIWYYPTFTELGSLATAIDTLIVPGWEDYCALQIATRLCIKERDIKKASALAQERDRKKALILEVLSPRDDFQADTIADLSNRFSNNMQHLIGNESRWLMYRIQAKKIYIRENEFAGV